jgi:putative acyl-CoA dehydrogenase
MSALRPQNQLETHDVTNQPPPFEDINLFSSDLALQEAVLRAGAEQHLSRLTDFGGRVGSAQTMTWAVQANRNPPQLQSFDRFGQRLDEVEFHPAYHALMTLGLEAGVAAAPWRREPHGHVLHAALEFLMSQAEPGVCCPMTMTYAAPAALTQEPSVAAQWLPKITSARYDGNSCPAAQKSAVTIGMAMTEKQGGSDVRANTTKATRNADDSYTLIGHKWFCSAPMSDAFLTLAYADGGLTCFLVPRWRPDGSRNAIHLMRLKDKLGDRSNASSEIEYHGAFAQRVGEEGRGVRTIIEMVQHTRLDCAVAPAAFMRQALANAVWHTRHRRTFQRSLIDQPLMRTVLADMAIESEAATALVFRLAQSFDADPANQAEARFMRIATPIGKYWLNKRVVNFVYEAMESHGGAGYVEENIMPRLFRQSPLNSIWEGSGNVICLDVLRAMMREPESVAAFLDELECCRGADSKLDAVIDTLKDRLVQPPPETDARHMVEQMALALQASLLVRHGPPAVADGFCATRLVVPGATYGASGQRLDERAILDRVLPLT